MCVFIYIYKIQTSLKSIQRIIVPADDMGVVGHTQKTQTPMSSAK
jgi:hypothetical protein